jgi:hypothetical protein
VNSKRMNTVRGAIAAGMVAMSVLLSGGVASADTGNFLLVSNKGGLIGKVCFEAYSKEKKLLGGKCDTIATHQATRFFLPDKTSYSILSYRFDVNPFSSGTKATFTLLNTRSYCYRVSAGNALHEATDRPCTSK